jgi:hypothetical protein
LLLTSPIVASLGRDEASPCAFGADAYHGDRLGHLSHPVF